MTKMTEQQIVMQKMALREGSYVDITRRVSTDYVGWIRHEMDTAIGKTYRIKELTPYGFILRDFATWIFPAECLVRSDEDFNRILNEDKISSMTLHEAAVKALDLKVGDRVKVGFSVPTGFGGWDNKWCSPMDSNVGKTLTVKYISDKTGIRLEDGLNYPAFCLEKNSSETIKLTSDYDAIVHADKVIVGCQTIPVEKVREVVKIMKKLGADLD